MAAHVQMTVELAQRSRGLSPVAQRKYARIKYYKIESMQLKNKNLQGRQRTRVPV